MKRRQFLWSLVVAPLAMAVGVEKAWVAQYVTDPPCRTVGPDHFAPGIRATVERQMQTRTAYYNRFFEGRYE